MDGRQEQQPPMYYMPPTAPSDTSQGYQDNIPLYPSYVPLDRSQTFAPPAELGDDFIAGKEELKEQGLSEQKAHICVLLDVSRSMQNPNKFFNNEGANKVQEAINRILALAFSLDSNRQIDIIPFAGEAYNLVTIDRRNYKDATTLVLESLKDKNGPTVPNIYWNLKEDTNYAAAIRALRQHYFKENTPRQVIHRSTDLPVFAILLTDGNHNDEEKEAENQFKFASYHNIFIKSFGLLGKEATADEITKKFQFLKSIDDLKNSTKPVIPPKKSSGFFGFCCVNTDTVDDDKKEYTFCIDNTDFEAIVDPSKITMKQLIKEFRGWLEEAHKVGISKIPPKVLFSIKLEDEGRTLLKK